jgi:hypothetical protein
MSSVSNRVLQQSILAGKTVLLEILLSLFLHSSKSKIITCSKGLYAGSWASSSGDGKFLRLLSRPAELNKRCLDALAESFMQPLPNRTNYICPAPPPANSEQLPQATNYLCLMLSSFQVRGCILSIFNRNNRSDNFVAAWVFR